MKQYINKENMKVVGHAGLRIGKEIIREGTKTVAIKAVATAVGGAVANGIDGVKSIKLDDVLGDVTRAERREEKRIKRMKKRQARKEAKMNKQKWSDHDLEDLEKQVDEAIEKELNESFRHGLVKEADEIIKDLGEESEEK